MKKETVTTVRVSGPSPAAISFPISVPDGASVEVEAWAGWDLNGEALVFEGDVNSQVAQARWLDGNGPIDCLGVITNAHTARFPIKPDVRRLTLFNASSNNPFHVTLKVCAYPERSDPLDVIRETLRELTVRSFVDAERARRGTPHAEAPPVHHGPGPMPHPMRDVPSGMQYPRTGR